MNRLKRIILYYGPQWLRRKYRIAKFKKGDVIPCSILSISPKRLQEYAKFGKNVIIKLEDGKPTVYPVFRSSAVMASNPFRFGSPSKGTVVEFFPPESETKHLKMGELSLTGAPTSWSL